MLGIYKAETEHYPPMLGFKDVNTEGVPEPQLIYTKIKKFKAEFLPLTENFEIPVLLQQN